MHLLIIFHLTSSGLHFTIFHCTTVLQGRLPIRVELKGLTADDFYRILTEPENSMLRQQKVGRWCGRM